MFSLVGLCEGAMTLKQKFDSTSTGALAAETGWPLKTNRDYKKKSYAFARDKCRQTDKCRDRHQRDRAASKEETLAKTSPWNCQKLSVAETFLTVMTYTAVARIKKVYIQCVNVALPLQGWKRRHQRLWQKGLIFFPEVLNATCWMRASLGRSLVSWCDDMCHVPLMGVKLGLIQTRQHLRKLFFVMIPLKVTGDDGGHVISYSNNSQTLTKKKKGKEKLPIWVHLLQSLEDIYSSLGYSCQMPSG